MKKQKKFIEKNIRLLIVGTICLLTIFFAIVVNELTRQQIKKLTRASENEITLTLNPQSSNLGIDEEEDAIITLDSNGKKISGVDITIKYDPSIVHITKINSNVGQDKPFTDIILEEIHNSSGEARIFVFANKPDVDLPTGVIQLATIKVKGIGGGKSDLTIAPGYEIIGFTNRQDQDIKLVIEDSNIGTRDINGPTLVPPTPTITLNPTEPTGSPAPSSTPSPSSTPAATLTPTITPTTTIVPTQPPGNKVTFNMKLRFQGLTGIIDNSMNKMRVKITLMDGKLNQSISNIAEFSAESNGIWSGKAIFDNVPRAGGYKVLVKGPQHVQKRVCVPKPIEIAQGTYKCNLPNINIDKDELELDFSGIYLLVGDMAPQDGIVNAYDYSLIFNNLSHTDDIALRLVDNNKDKIIDTQDVTLIFPGLQVKYDEE